MDSTNQESIAYSYYPEIYKKIIEPFTVMNGKTVRRLYVRNKWQQQIIDWVDAGIEPACTSQEDRDDLIKEWFTEAEIAYPSNGDYRVRVSDEQGNIVPLTTEITPIIDELQVEVPACDTIVPVCPDRRIVFQICNENAVTDDNFVIYLNGVVIGMVDLNAAAEIGSVFIGDLNPATVLIDSDFDCPLANMVVYHFDPALIQQSNVVEMINLQDNGSGNEGTIGVRNYLITGTDLSDPCLIVNLTYSGSSGVDFAFTFDYTDCCN
jgi:hypothetical protein